MINTSAINHPFVTEPLCATVSFNLLNAPTLAVHFGFG